MPLSKGSTRTGSEHQCGPTLMLSMLAAVLALFVLIFVFSHHHNQTPPHIGQPPAVATLPTQ